MGRGGDDAARGLKRSGGRPPRAPDNLSAEGRQEILIDGRLYDITDFKKRHPGGSVIGFYLVRTPGVATHAVAECAVADYVRACRASDGNETINPKL